MKKHSKRYMVIFSMWEKNPKSRCKDELSGLVECVHTETEFDTEVEWKEETKLIEEIYGDTIRPHKEDLIPTYYNNYKRYRWVFEEGSKFYGYIVLDFQKQQIVKLGGDGIYKFHSTTTIPRVTLEMLDYYFRGDDEIPKGYSFDTNEYEGWLKFRWGDHSNAVPIDKMPKEWVK